MPKDSIFRKSSLERISSPEQLNSYLRVASPGLWFVLAGLGAVLAAFLAWGIFGHILESVAIPGTAMRPAGQELEFRSYLPIDQGRPLLAGMDVQVSPDYAPRETYGYINAQVESVSSVPVTAAQVRDQLGSDADLLSLPDGNLIEVIVKPELDGGGNLVWSRPEGEAVDVLVGSSCTLTVITAERRPIDLLFR